ncbi:Plexin-C1 [Manis pentadactyla]|nr:Plexin-C1 [Manis pentadactyla]
MRACVRTPSALPPRRPGLRAQTPEVTTDRIGAVSGRTGDPAGSPRTLLTNSLLSFLDEKFAGASAAPSRGRVVVETEVADIPDPSHTVSAKDRLRQGVACASAEPCGPPGTRPPVLHPAGAQSQTRQSSPQAEALCVTEAADGQACAPRGSWDSVAGQGGAECGEGLPLHWKTWQPTGSGLCVYLSQRH